jgi:hypothetical protein
VCIGCKRTVSKKTFFAQGKYYYANSSSETKLTLKYYSNVEFQFIKKYKFGFTSTMRKVHFCFQGGRNPEKDAIIN